MLGGSASGNAANDPRAIYLNYTGSPKFRRRQVRSMAPIEIRYLVGLINDHVAPPAWTPQRQRRFLLATSFWAGKMPFQSGTYSLAPVARDALFHWCGDTAGPAGRVGVTNGIAAAGNSASKHPMWCAGAGLMGSTGGQPYLPPRCGHPLRGSRASAQPASTQWSAGVSHAHAVLAAPSAHSGSSAAPASPPDAGPRTLLLDEMFLGCGDKNNDKS